MNYNNNMIKYKKWFNDYSGEFFLNCTSIQKQTLQMKVQHTFRVCQDILCLGKSINLSEHDLFLVELAALFHDIGRFEQYSRYNTFVDSKSENHAELGKQILIENKTLTKLDSSDQELILGAIGYHNQLSLPESESEKCLLISRLLRDSDKLDIWDFVIEYYLTDKERIQSIELDLPDDSELSPEAVNDFMSGHLVKKHNMKRLNDFKLLKISWIYDINFQKTLHIVKNRKYIEKLIDLLPEVDLKPKIVSLVQAYFQKHSQLPVIPNKLPPKKYP